MGKTHQAELERVLQAELETVLQAELKRVPQAEEEVQCLLWEKYASWCFQRSEGVRAGLRDSNLTAGGYRKQLQADFLST